MFEIKNYFFFFVSNLSVKLFLYIKLFVKFLCNLRNAPYFCFGKKQEKEEG